MTLGRQKDNSEENSERKPFWSIAEEQIQEAIEAGEFDDLPGMGKPLHLEPDRHVPIEHRLAYRIMRDNNVLPEWIQLQQELEVLIQRTRQELRARERAASQMESKAEHLDDPIAAVRLRLDARDCRDFAAAAFRDRIRVINRRISLYNLKVPAAYLTRDLLDPEAELRKLYGENQTK